MSNIPLMKDENDFKVSNKKKKFKTEKEIIIESLDAYIEFYTAIRRFSDVGFYEKVKKFIMENTNE